MKRYGSVFVLGDSHAGPIGRILRERMGADVVLVDYVNGRRTRDLIADPEIPTADLNVIVLGGNDQPSGTYPGTLLRFLNLIPRGDILWVGPFRATDPPTRGRHDEVRAIQARTLPSTRARWIDGYRLSRESDLRADGVHFTEAGYQRIADQILKSNEPGITGIMLGAIMGVMAWVLDR